MNLNQFVDTADFLHKAELEKVKLLAFFYQSQQPDFQFSIDQVCEWFGNLGVHQPNKTRLRQNIRKSRAFVNGNQKAFFRLHATTMRDLNEEFPKLGQKSEEVEAGEAILPSGLFEKTRGYIESLSKQINACYENNIFDGCAVLMRRLIEICLIQAYENNGITQSIEGLQGYKPLVDIINDAITNKKLSLSKTTKDCLSDFRTLGNFSAHKIFYNAKRGDIKKVVLEYRAAIEELLYKAGIKK